MSIIFLIFLFGILLTGCSPENKSIPDINPENISGIVTIYRVDGTPFYNTDGFYYTTIKRFESKYANCKVEVKSFPSDEEMQLKMASEVLSNQGADVLLIDYTNKVDIFKMAASGGLMDFSPLLEQDETYNRDDYYGTVLDAGMLNGKHYIMPLGFTFPYLCTTAEHLEREGIALSSSYNFEDLAIVLTSKIEEYKNDPQKVVLQDVSKIHFSLFSVFLGASGIQPIDYGSKTADFNTDSFRYICDLFKSLDQEAAKREASNRSFQRSIQGIIQHRNNTLLRLTLETPLLSYCTQTSTDREILNETTMFLTIPIYESTSNSVNAMVLSSAMINNNSSNPAAAYWFVRELMTGMHLSNPQYSDQLFIKKSNMEYCIESMESKSPWKGDLNGVILPLSTENSALLKNHIASIDTAVITNSYVDEIIYECMLPYFQDVKSYDECLAILTNRIKLYLSE